MLKVFKFERFMSFTNIINELLFVLDFLNDKMFEKSNQLSY